MRLKHDDNKQSTDIAITCLLSALFALATWLMLVNNRERVLQMIGWQSHMEVGLREEFAEFINDWETVSIGVQECPGLVSQRDVVEWVFDDVLSRRQRCKHIESGIDSWGGPIVIKVLERKYGEEIELRLIVRSNGPNGVDEAGRADDIEMKSSPMRYANRSNTKVK